MPDVVLDRGMPANIEAERLVLGALLVGDADYGDVSATLTPDDFSMEKHRRIFARMGDLHERGARIEHVTVGDELERHGQLESCDGLAYLASLDDGLPRIVNVDGYVGIVREKSTLRRAMFECQRIIERCAVAHDGAAEILADAERVLVKLTPADQHGEWLQPGEIIQAHPEILQPRRGELGIPMPWPSLTDQTCGFQVGDLFVIAGRPSMGKTAAAVQIAAHAADAGRGVAFFSLEMTGPSLIRRLLALAGRVDAQSIRAGTLNAEDRARALAAANAVQRIPFWIDDTRARTMPAINSALRKLRARAELSIVCVDHLQLMKSSGRAESRVLELSEIAHGLKHLAGELGVTVILLSQLNRECEREKRRPQLSDLKECGAVEEDADVVLFIHRPEQYNRQDPALRGQAEFITAKQRNGPTGKLPMVFRHAFQLFEERDGGSAPPERRQRVLGEGNGE